MTIFIKLNKPLVNLELTEGVVKALQTLTEPARRDPEDLKMTTDTTESILRPEAWSDATSSCRIWLAFRWICIPAWPLEVWHGLVSVVGIFPSP